MTGNPPSSPPRLVALMPIIDMERRTRCRDCGYKLLSLKDELEYGLRRFSCTRCWQERFRKKHEES